MRIMVSAQGGMGGHLFKVSRQLIAIMNHMYPCTPTYIGYFSGEPPPPELIVVAKKYSQINMVSIFQS